MYLPLSKIFLLDFRTVLTVWYFISRMFVQVTHHVYQAIQS